MPEIYRLIFKNTTKPSLLETTEQQKTDIGLDYDSTSWSGPERQRAIVEEYFRTACSNGWVTAIENTLLLSYLRSKKHAPTCYFDEPAIIYGTLSAAREHNMPKEIIQLVAYCRLQNLDLECLFSQKLGEIALSDKVIESLDDKLAEAVFRSWQGGEGKLRLEYITDQLQAIPPKVSSTNEDELLEVRKSIEAVLKFCGLRISYGSTSDLSWMDALKLQEHDSWKGGEEMEIG